MHFKRSHIVLGGALLLAAAATLRLTTANTAWEEMLATGSRLEQSIADRETVRPVLYGEAIEGLAFDEYAQIEELLSETSLDDWIAVVRARQHGEPEAKKLRDSLIDEHYEVLAALDRGARCTDARFPIEWDRELPCEVPTLMRTRTAVNIAVLAAERDLEEGHPELASEKLMSAMQLGRDIAESPILLNECIGVALLVIASKEALIDNGLIECFPSSELSRIARAMETLDRRLSPISQAWEYELAAFVRRSSGGFTREPLDQNRFGPWSVEFSMRALPHGLSTRAMLANYVDEADRLVRTLQALNGKSYHARHAAHVELQGENSGYDDVLVQRFLAMWHNPETSRRDGIALLRLARCAVQYQIDGSLLELRDPYGADLLVTPSAGTIRIESAGRIQDPTGFQNRNHLVVEFERNGG